MYIDDINVFAKNEKTTTVDPDTNNKNVQLE